MRRYDVVSGMALVRSPLRGLTVHTASPRGISLLLVVSREPLLRVAPDVLNVFSSVIRRSFWAYMCDVNACRAIMAYMILLFIMSLFVNLSGFSFLYPHIQESDDRRYRGYAGYLLINIIIRKVMADGGRRGMNIESCCGACVCMGMVWAIF